MKALSHLQIVAAGAFAVCAWQANRSECRGCRVEALRLRLGGDSSAYARFYRPDVDAVGLPAVVVAHGYLANISFVEVPWAADLTQLGAAALFVDRRGHGRSDGTLFPTAERNVSPERLEPELAAALDFLRSEAPTIDPDRIAVLGHSDGGTAALITASADWGVASTVALSASAAPWDQVNHVAPRNLLLVYGAEDQFVLRETDRMLIANATRGYLSGAGRVGTFANGSARELVRVPGRGHVDVLYSDAARRLVLDWLRRSLRAPGTVALSPLQHGWVAGGALAVLAFLAAGRTAVTAKAARVGQVPGRWAHVALLAAFWVAGLWLAPRLARAVPTAPAQEGRVVVGLLTAETLALLGGALLVPAVCRRFRAVHHERSNGVGEGAGGSLLRSAGAASVHATGVILAFTVLLRHLYQVALLAPHRLALLGLFSLAALPLLCVLERWGSLLGRERAALGLLLLALSTAGAAPRLFERMAVLPVYAFAFSLVVLMAYRFGRARRNDGAGTAVFGALVCGWATSTVCALY